MLSGVKSWEDVVKVLDTYDRLAEETTKRILVGEINKGVRRALSRNTESEKNIAGLIKEHVNSKYYADRISQKSLDWYNANKGQELTDPKDIAKMKRLEARIESHKGKEYLGDLSTKELQDLQRWVAETDEVARAVWQQLKEQNEKVTAGHNKDYASHDHEKRQRAAVKPGVHVKPTKFEKMGAVWQQIKKGSLFTVGKRIFLDYADGGKRVWDGFFSRKFGYDFDDKYVKFYSRMGKIEKGLEDIAEKHGKLTADEDIDVFLHAMLQQHRGEEYLLYANASAEDIANIKEKGLNEKQQAYYDYYRDTLDKIFPEAKFVAGKHWGAYVDFVENYFPIAFDPEGEATFHDFHNPGGSIPGALLRRKGPAAGAVLKISAGELFHNYVDTMLYQIEVKPYILELNRLVESPEFLKNAGDINQEVFRAYLRRADAQWRMPASERGPLQKFVGVVSNMVRFGLIGYSLKTLAHMPTNIVAGWWTAGTANMVRGVHMASTAEGQAWLKEYFPELVARRYSGASHVEISEYRQSKFMRGGYRAMGELDAWAVQPTAVAMYLKWCDDHGQTADFSKPPPRDAVHVVDDFVNKYTGFSSERERPMYMTGGKHMWIKRASALLGSYSQSIGGTMGHALVKLPLAQKGNAIMALMMISLADWFMDGFVVKPMFNYISGAKKGKKEDDIVKDLFVNLADPFSWSLPYLSNIIAAGKYGGVSYLPATLTQPANAINEFRYMLSSKKISTKERHAILLAFETAQTFGIPVQTAKTLYKLGSRK
jgi:hypothetical protein